MGCYKDDKDRALPSQQPLNKQLGKLTEQCIEKCRSLNHPYAALQYSTECFCGTTYDKYGKVNESLCNTECQDSSGMNCGGTWNMSVYRICK